MEILEPKFSDRLMEWMKAAGIPSVNELAARADVDQSQLNKIATNKLKVSDNTLRKLAPHLPATLGEMRAAAAVSRIGPEIVGLIWDHILRRKLSKAEIGSLLAELPVEDQDRLFRELAARRAALGKRTREDEDS